MKHTIQTKIMIGATKMQLVGQVKNLILMLVLLAASQAHAAVATIQQDIELQPGWNAIHVEVEPINNKIDTIFAGVPVASVWRWIPNKVGSDFIQDPAEGLLSLDGWFGYFPEPRPEAFLSNLYTISGNTSYLIYLDDNHNRSVQIAGTPVLTNVTWKSNGFTLTGLPVNPAVEPTFSAYFALSDAHLNQPIYQLNSAGFWELVTDPSTRSIKSGEAYWIFTDGISNYPGLIDIKLQQGDSLEYRTVFTEMSFMLSNLSDVTNFVNIQRVGGVNMPMKFLNVDPETGEEAWPDLPVNRVVELAPGEDVFIKFAVDRKNFSEERMEQIFSITNEQGARYLLHAGASTVQPLTLPTRKTRIRGVEEVPVSNAGLWIGTVEVNAVSEAQSGAVEARPVGKPFIYRVMIHVDATGTAKLVKNIVQMWQEGTYSPSASDPDFLEVDTPGNYVLLTDNNLIPNFSGVTIRSGQSAGIRYSTVAYDFNGNEVEMNGTLAVSDSLSVNLLVDSDLPTNPFLHKYHPDHDNLDAQFLNYKQEAFQVTREMQFLFLANNPEYPDVDDPPGWGYQIMGGEYRESISGLHKNTIFIEGEFKLQRVAATPVLNQ